MNDPDMEDMQRLGAAMIPYAKKMAEHAKANLPEGVHWGVIVLPPAPLRPAPDDKVGRMPVVVITSDRDVVAPQVAFWVMDVLGGAR